MARKRKVWSDEERRKARDLFIITGKSYTEISEMTEIPIPTLHSWGSRERWSFLKGQVDTPEWTSDILDVSLEHIEVYKRFCDKINGLIDEVEDPKEIKCLAETYKLSEERITYHLNLQAIGAGDNEE